MTHPSVNSIVEIHCAGLEALLAAVHADDPKREILVRIGDAMREARQAATIISELQAERDALRKSYNLAITSRLEWRRQAETTNRRLLETHQAYEETKVRALTAESSLSRIREQAIEALGDCHEYFTGRRRPELMIGMGHPPHMSKLVAKIASAIRSLDKNCSGKTGAAG